MIHIKEKVYTLYLGYIKANPFGSTIRECLCILKLWAEHQKYDHKTRKNTVKITENSQNVRWTTFKVVEIVQLCWNRSKSLPAKGRNLTLMASFPVSRFWVSWSRKIRNGRPYSSKVRLPGKADIVVGFLCSYLARCSQI